MGLFSKNKDNNISATLLAEDGITSIGKGNVVIVTALDDESKIEIKMPFTKKGTPNVYLGYSQISAIERISDMQIITYEKNRNSIGRAIGGGLLLGPLGATVGAISGVGTKKKEKKEFNFYIVINYLSSDGETKIITFKERPDTFGIGVGKFIKHIKEVSNLNDIELPSEINL